MASPESVPGTSRQNFLQTPSATDGTPDSSSSTARLTPQSDSEDEPDLGGPYGGEQRDGAFELKAISKSRPQSSKDDSNWNQDDDSVEEWKDGSEDELFTDFNGSRRPSASTTRSFMLYTPDEERGVVRKFDRRVVLLMALLYMLSFLDRSNIGNARIAGLEGDLHLDDASYEWCLTSFYITYILFEWMTLLYRLIPPHIYISICVLSWGLLASLQSLATSFLSLFILRALLGISEAAFGPGVPFYLSFFYKREELALRTGLFISAAPLATSFASSLAWLITRLGQNGPIAPWRLLFLVEGFPSVFVAVFAWILVPDSPGKASFLTRRERKVAKLRQRKEKGDKADGKGKGLNWREILQTLADPKCYLTAAMFFSCNVAFSSLPVFLPTIINEMGHSALSSQALSAPPFLVAFAVVIVTAFLSDRLRTRSLFVGFHALTGALGYTLVAVAGWRGWGPTWRYVGVYPAAAGFFSAITIIITWTINNQPTASRQGTGMAMLNIIGQCGPLLGTRLYPDEDKPLYVRGMLVCAAFMLLVFFLALTLRFILARENQRSAAVAYQAVGDDHHEDSVGTRVRGKAGEQFRFIL